MFGGRRLHPMVSLAVVGALVLVACGDDSDDGARSAPTEENGTPTSARETETVRVAVTPNIADPGPILIAQERGYFEEQGIEVDMTVLGLPEVVGGVTSGSIDVVSHTVWAGMYNAMAQTETRIVAGVGQVEEGHAGSGMVLRNDLVDEIDGVEDLEGRTIGHCGLNGACEYAIELFLAKGGLETSDVDLVEVQFVDIPASMANNAVDLALIAEPLYSAGVEQGAFQDFMRSDEFFPLPFTSTVMYYSGPFRTARQDVAQRFMNAWLRGARDWISALTYDSGDADEIIETLTSSDLVPIDVAAVERMQSLNGVSAIDPEGYGAMDSAPELLLEWLQGRGLVEDAVDIDDLVDISFIDEANRELGPYEPPN